MNMNMGLGYDTVGHSDMVVLKSRIQGIIYDMITDYL